MWSVNRKCGKCCISPHSDFRKCENACKFLGHFIMHPNSDSRVKKCLPSRMSSQFVPVTQESHYCEQRITTVVTGWWQFPFTIGKLWTVADTANDNQIVPLFRLGAFCWDFETKLSKLDDPSFAPSIDGAVPEEKEKAWIEPMSTRSKQSLSTLHSIGFW